jgi:hypothetical protein
MYEPPDPVLTATEHAPPESDEGVIGTGSAALIVTEKSFVDEALLAPATRTVKLELPAVVGVPLRTPPVDKLRPAGSVPTDTDQL